MSEVSQTPRAPVPASPYRRYLWAAIALVLLLAVWGILSRLLARNALAHEAREAAIPTVITTRPHQGPAADTLLLPGSVQAYYEAPIYARTSGYLKAWYTDIGAPVKKGELLAEIEAPEVDQQLRQAEADLGTARAKAAAQASAAANVARLRELEGFKRVVAPFDGIVTQRNTDVGALINAGETPGSALFRVADTHRLRIYVQVPQVYAAQVRTGMSTSLEFTDHPGQHFAANVASTAHALDAVSRTLQVELQIDNSGGELLPGSYVQVTFALAPSGGALRVPVNTVIFRGHAPQVATIDEAHRVHLQEISEGRDFGTEIEVLAGVSANDTLIVNPWDSIADGQQVRIQPPQPQQTSGAPPAEHS